MLQNPHILTLSIGILVVLIIDVYILFFFLLQSSPSLFNILRKKNPPNTSLCASLPMDPVGLGIQLEGADWYLLLIFMFEHSF